ncbi:6-phosphogluconolactonase [Marinobacter zhejiangensis]|uniref:6-phosphogluconolactonase n=1 Tax=Marinobacter zhejiangensis TaxID=488535 RepID=A0A1I4NY26_9GAMM|nr:6-phosphogluconolactonase [Marinobacter zhejiangensis]SFM20369.1 6-phosphogluconolactonase [Marinobacter zhejiangensis]
MKTPDFELPNNVDMVIGDDGHSVASMLAEKVAGVLDDRLQRPGRASLAVSGGKTPIAFLELLSCKPIDWSRVDVVLVDERCVNEDDPASNARLVKQYLLRGPASAARYVPIWQDNVSVADGCRQAEKALDLIEWPLTALVLGMGVDGHTASLFPDAPELYAALDASKPARVLALTPPSQSHPRVSLTLRALGGAQYKALHLKGMDKLEALKQASERLDDVAEMPIRLFLSLGVVVFWSA